MSRRWLIAGLSLALMAGPAQAQLSSSQNQMNAASRLGNTASHKGGEDASSKAKVSDKAYNSALRNLPDKQFDPWHGMR